MEYKDSKYINIKIIAIAADGTGNRASASFLLHEYGDMQSPNPIPHHQLWIS